jgi:hypothetical protein
MIASILRKVTCRNNAPTVSFSDRLKIGQVHCTTCAMRVDAQADVFDYIKVIQNRRRRHSTLGYRSPGRLLENRISRHVEQLR